MGSIKAEQIPKTMQFLQQDLPALLLTIGKIEDTDEYWIEVSEMCNACYQKNHNAFAKKMILALADYLEDQMKKSKHGGIST